MDNKLKILLVLVSIFVFLLVYRTMNPYRQKTVEKLTYSTDIEKKNKKKSDNATNNNSVKNFLVMLDVLKNRPLHSGTVYKNIFFDQPVKKAKTYVQKQIKKKQPFVTKKSQIDLIKKELSNLKLFGTYETRGKTALFIEIDNQIMVVNKGDIIKGKYIVKEITPDLISIDVKNLDETLHIDFNSFIK